MTDGENPRGPVDHSKRPWFLITTAIIVPLVVALIPVLIVIRKDGGSTAAPPIHSGDGTSPTRSATTTIGGTATSGTPTPSQAPPVSAVYWQGAVGITFGPPGGINFDLKPPTTSADSPTNISYGSNTLENAWTGTTVLVSQWTGAGRPTHAQCANWVLTHPTNVVNNVAEGMRICIRTVQGRIGQLMVTSISPDHSTLNVVAVIWN